LQKVCFIHGFSTSDACKAAAREGQERTEYGGAPDIKGDSLNSLGPSVKNRGFSDWRARANQLYPDTKQHGSERNKRQDSGEVSSVVLFS
jgi:hypothetical protein